MTETKLQSLVTQAVQLDREIARAEDELKTLKQLIIAEAESRPDEHARTDGGGWSWSQMGHDGCIARVTKSGPKLKSSIDPESKAGSSLMALVGKWKSQLFTPAIKYNPCDNFRATVESIFDRADARRIIKSCETAGTTSVSFETKEKSEAA